MDKKVTFDLTPIMTEIFQIKASVHTIEDILTKDFDDEQYKKVRSMYAKNLSEIVVGFVGRYPTMFENPDELIQQLTSEFEKSNEWQQSIKQLLIEIKRWWRNKSFF